MRLCKSHYSFQVPWSWATNAVITEVCKSQSSATVSSAPCQQLHQPFNVLHLVISFNKFEVWNSSKLSVKPVPTPQRTDRRPYQNQSVNDVYANDRYLFVAPFEPHKYTVWQNAICYCYSRSYIRLSMGLKWLTTHCSFVHSWHTSA
jgi:hypothetical protein